jgi:GTP-binding protein HflX
LLLHIVDVTHPNVLQHIETVEDTLAQLDVPPIPRILIWNKIDRKDSTPPRYSLGEPYIAEARVSAQMGTGISQLLNLIETSLTAHLRMVRLLIPYQRGELLAALFQLASVESQEHTSEGVIVTVQLPPSLYERYMQFQIVG